MRRLDAMLLQLAEAFAHCTQEWVGLTSFFWCRGGLTTQALGALLMVTSYWLVEDSGRRSVLQLFFVLYVPFTQALRTRVIRIEDKWQRDPSTLPSELAVLRARTSIVHRIITLVVMTLVVLNVPMVPFRQSAIDLTFIGGMLCYEYFIHVNPKPPAPSKLRQFFDAPFFRLVPIRGR